MRYSSPPSLKPPPAEKRDEAGSMELEAAAGQPKPGGAAVETRRLCGAATTQLGLRLACLVSSVLSLSLMVSAEQSATLSLYGFHLPLYAKWSFSESFEYVAAAMAVAAGQSLVAALLMAWKWPMKATWLGFAVDQTMAYVILSAGAAAAGVTNLNRTGIHHVALPDFCQPLRRFCGAVGMSVGFAFLSWLLLAVIAAIDVISLSGENP